MSLPVAIVFLPLIAAALTGLNGVLAFVATAFTQYTACL